MNGSSSSTGTTVRMMIFRTILSILLVIGIVTSTSITSSSSSFFQFNGKIITDAKATSNGGIQGGGGLVSNTPHKEVTMIASDATIEVKPGVKVGVLTPVTNKTVSMIDWQYQLQKKLQKPIPLTAAEENENAATVSSMNMHASDLNQSLRSASTIDIPLGATTPKNGQYYSPENTQLPVNSKVTWTNKDNIPHTSTADDNSFDTDVINPGDSSSPITLSGSAGANIAYHCALHPWMKASITLSSSPSASTSPSSTSIPTAGQVQKKNQLQ
ncbi:MAG: hypothetical protein ACJ71X_00105 [Nitrososphaeraceae archaeon]